MLEEAGIKPVPHPFRNGDTYSFMFHKKQDVLALSELGFAIPHEVLKHHGPLNIKHFIPGVTLHECMGDGAPPAVLIVGAKTQAIMNFLRAIDIDLSQTETSSPPSMQINVRGAENIQKLHDAGVAFSDFMLKAAGIEKETTRAVR